jgi:hypothetical protein
MKVFSWVQVASVARDERIGVCLLHRETTDSQSVPCEISWAKVS